MNLQIPCSALPIARAAEPSVPLSHLSSLVNRWKLTPDPVTERRVGAQVLATTRTTIPQCEYREGPCTLLLRTYLYDDTVHGSYELLGHHATPVRGVLVFNDFIPKQLNEDPIAFFKKIADM